VSGTNSTLTSPGPRDDPNQASPTRAFAKSRTKRAAKPRVQKIVTNTSTKPRVLVVDDVADVTEMIALFLKHAGFEVMTANSAMAALKITSQSQFDLIISDIGMPEMNGYDLAASLRKSDSYQATPMIAVTGYTEYDDRGRSLDAGFNAHLTKPINPSRLLALIGDLLA
jgi:two-component system, chemotaxis family, CheB/CheR fusion protein